MKREKKSLMMTNPKKRMSKSQRKNQSLRRITVEIKMVYLRIIKTTYK